MTTMRTPPATKRHAFLFGIFAVILAGSTPFGDQQPPVTPPPAGTPEAAPPGRGRGGRGAAAVRLAEVAADGRVTFRLRAPTAQAVAVTMGGNQRFEMKKDEQGVWSRHDRSVEAGLLHLLAGRGRQFHQRPGQPERADGIRQLPVDVRRPRTGPVASEPMWRMAQSRGIVSSRPWRRTIAISLSTRRPATTPGALARIPSCICCTALATMRSVG